MRHNAARGTVNQLLTEMDGLSADNEGVFILGATNHPWDVDVALRRPGRFDRMVLVLPPDEPARQAIFKFHLRDRPIANIDLGELARRTDGYSGADLAHVCETGAERALLDSAPLDLALALLARVREEAEARDLSLAVAVVDPSGDVLASQRMDGAALGAMRLAAGKAYTAVSWATPSGDFGRSTQPGGDDWGWNTTDPRVVVYAGGIPLLVDGELVGRDRRERRDGDRGRRVRHRRGERARLRLALRRSSRAASGAAAQAPDRARGDAATRP